jgi:hypothetical protein
MGFTRSVERMERLAARLRGGMQARGITGEDQETIVRGIHSFALYGFPESHAASFALIAYASAYLRRHHPAAFLVGLLNAQPMGFYGPATLVKDAQRHGVEVRPIASPARPGATAQQGGGASLANRSSCRSAGERRPFSKARASRGGAPRAAGRASRPSGRARPSPASRISRRASRSGDELERSRSSALAGSILSGGAPRISGRWPPSSATRARLRDHRLSDMPSPLRNSAPRLRNRLPERHHDRPP